MTDNISAEDYAAYATQPTGTGELSRLQVLAEEQVTLQNQLAQLEAQAKAVSQKITDLAERQIPELMDEIGIAEFTTTSGVKIEVKETIRAAIPKQFAGRAIAWLHAHGHGALVKTTVAVKFGMGQEEQAEKVYRELLQEGLPAEENATVHPSTLSSWAKEMLADGEEIPLDLFGVFRQRVAKIKL